MKTMTDKEPITKKVIIVKLWNYMRNGKLRILVITC